MSEKKYYGMPIPRGNSAYALAKRAEYISKDTSLAMHYYMESISLGERVESAVKDLASLMHQDGKTKEGIDLLRQNIQLCTDTTKVENLIKTLESKLEPTKSSLLKTIKLSPLQRDDSDSTVRNLFKDQSRIGEVKISHDSEEFFALISFKSHSAARKTVNSYKDWGTHSLEWVDQSGDTAGIVVNFKKEKRNAEVKTDPKTAMMLLGKSLFIEIFAES